MQPGVKSTQFCSKDELESLFVYSNNTKQKLETLRRNIPIRAVSIICECSLCKNLWFDTHFSVESLSPRMKFLQAEEKFYIIWLDKSHLSMRLKKHGTFKAFEGHSDALNVSNWLHQVDRYFKIVVPRSSQLLLDKSVNTTFPST